ncbi:hypothetical protein DFP73DRAFT_184106 [Morchella snyderi]|nr:hypothetical protein DFP73DRAFT_184106 [Morchella snyderi]
MNVVNPNTFPSVYAFLFSPLASLFCCCCCCSSSSSSSSSLSSSLPPLSSSNSSSNFILISFPQKASSSNETAPDADCSLSYVFHPPRRPFDCGSIDLNRRSFMGLWLCMYSKYWSMELHMARTLSFEGSVFGGARRGGASDETAIFDYSFFLT